MMPGMAPAAGGGQHASAGIAALRVEMSLMPQWLALLWTLVLLAVVVSHGRHLLASSGERRFWHASHVLVAVGMAFMFAPPSIGHISIPPLAWQLIFANAGGIVLAVLLGRVLEGSSTNVLWLASAIELPAMTYMWLGQTVVVLSWLFACYFVVLAAFWVLGVDRWVDGHWWLGQSRRTVVALAGGRSARRPDGGRSGGPARSLVCSLDVRASLAMMAFAMAQMLTAMVLAR